MVRVPGRARAAYDRRGLSGCVSPGASNARSARRAPGASRGEARPRGSTARAEPPGSLGVSAARLADLATLHTKRQRIAILTLAQSKSGIGAPGHHPEAWGSSSWGARREMEGRG